MAKINRAFLLVILLCISQYVLSQDTSKLATDRPDQTDGANMLNKGEVQFETEMYYNTFEEGRAAIISSTLLRYGLLKNFEVRLLVEDGRERDKFIAETTQGLYPLALSAKILLLKHHPVLPDLVLVTYLKMPLTRRSSDDVYWSPTFMLGQEKEINDFTIATNIAIKQAAFEKGWNWQASADLKFNLNKHIELFTEYFAQYEKHENPTHNADAGLLYYLNNNWLLHAAYGTTFLTQQSNHFTNVGFAFRIQ